MQLLAGLLACLLACSIACLPAPSSSTGELLKGAQIISTALNIGNLLYASQAATRRTTTTSRSPPGRMAGWADPSPGSHPLAAGTIQGPSRCHVPVVRPNVPRPDPNPNPDPDPDPPPCLSGGPSKPISSPLTGLYVPPWQPVQQHRGSPLFTAYLAFRTWRWPLCALSRGPPR